MRGLLAARVRLFFSFVQDDTLVEEDNEVAEGPKASAKPKKSFVEKWGKVARNRKGPKAMGAGIRKTRNS
jgi:hypothetical protein